MTHSRLLLPLLLLLSSCALAQRGTLRSERVIITNQDTSVYPPNDFIIRNSSFDTRVRIGINAANDRGILSLYNANDNLTFEVDTAEQNIMLRILADSPNVGIIGAGHTIGGTGLDMGYFEVLGEDRVSGLDASTSIQGGDVTANTLLLRTTNAGAAQLQLDDSVGSGGLVTLTGYVGTGTSYSLNLPQLSPNASGCSPCVLQFTTAGVGSFVAASGGVSFPLSQNVTFSADNLYTVGAGGGNYPSILYGRVASLGKSGSYNGQVQFVSTSGSGVNLSVNTSGYLLIDNNVDVNGGYVNAFSGFQDNGVAGIDSSFSCATTVNITVSGGLITAISCT